MNKQLQATRCSAIARKYLQSSMIQTVLNQSQNAAERLPITEKPNMTSTF